MDELGKESKINIDSDDMLYFVALRDLVNKRLFADFKARYDSFVLHL